MHPTYRGRIMICVHFFHGYPDRVAIVIAGDGVMQMNG
jgi:hypothetical protein